MSAADNVNEGWAAQHSGQRKFHYYRRNTAGMLRSLCGHWGIWPDQERAILPLSATDSIGPADCAGCHKRLASTK